MPGIQGQAWPRPGGNSRDGVCTVWQEGPAATLHTLCPLVFAYGATGAGKTHTMLGRDGDPGVMYLTTMELYQRLEALQEEKRFEVLVSYLEVRLSLRVG